MGPNEHTPRNRPWLRRKELEISHSGTTYLLLSPAPGQAPDNLRQLEDIFVAREPAATSLVRFERVQRPIDGTTRSGADIAVNSAGEPKKMKSCPTISQILRKGLPTAGSCRRCRRQKGPVQIQLTAPAPTPSTNRYPCRPQSRPTRKAAHLDMAASQPVPEPLAHKAKAAARAAHDSAVTNSPSSSASSAQAGACSISSHVSSTFLSRDCRQRNRHAFSICALWLECIIGCCLRAGGELFLCGR